MKIGFVSLGCPKNQLDTEVMLHELLSAGYEITADETEADVVIVNTCAFIESAKRESIDSILDIAWLKESGVPFAFRVPCIPGVNDSAEDRVAFISFADGAKIEFLPYNQAAGAKYPMLGRTYPMDGFKV